MDKISQEIDNGFFGLESTCMVAAPLKKTKQQMMGSTWLALDKIERRTPESANT
jgi:hypothetical protein